MNNERTILDQADGLRCLFKRKVCLDKVRTIQVDLRQAIIAGKDKDACALMVLLEKAQKELEETYPLNDPTA
ncbi:hypothetical protein [Vibrio sp. CAU 1672]|uniref:hypothetical protein n=1 Tax=Vibrio sp. CAU 1672 TaxID=3032594 RepID=UPI0023DAF360|nr:hypothetical protein [Vibrio sp. CAU 1672]MDF2155765.1 hypothetical protein [Vibrio sp. CAU 1672]